MNQVDHYRRFSGPLTFSAIVGMVGELCYGPLRPDQIHASGLAYEKLLKLWETLRRPGNRLMLCGCEIVYDHGVDENVLLFVDSSNPITGECNGRFEIEESSRREAVKPPLPRVD